MSVDPKEVRTESHGEVGQILIRDAGVLLGRWSERAAQEQPQAKRVHHEVLLDHLGSFLKKLGQSLIESRAPHTDQHQQSASEHGEQRWDHGWSLAEVVRDYQILRLVILDYLEEVLDRPLDCREGLAIGLALDEAITASVVSFTEERDAHMARLEGERAETDRRIQRQLHEQAETLREADRRKNEFLAILSHELRNPLASIYTALEIQRLRIPDDSELHEAREIIDRQVHHMTRLVDDLLDVSRITQGKVQLAQVPVDVALIVRRSLETAMPDITSRSHQLTVDLGPTAIWVKGDPSRLTQVLTNLLCNAAKYTPDSGQIEVSAVRKAREVELHVTDTGVGIAPEMLPRIFDPFVQADRSLDRSDGGLGLGLTLVRSLIELHGGTIEARSAGKGRGSEFVIRLPAFEEAGPPKEVPRPIAAETKGSKRRILVVDDNHDAAKTLAMLLKLDGHEVDMAHDGFDALKLAAAWKPEVMLLDIGLPGIDGLEVARRLQADAALSAIQLIAVTGYGQDDDQMRSQAAGFHAHLVKPIELDTLRQLFASAKQAVR